MTDTAQALTFEKLEALYKEPQPELPTAGSLRLHFRIAVHPHSLFGPSSVINPVDYLRHAYPYGLELRDMDVTGASYKKAESESPAYNVQVDVRFTLWESVAWDGFPRTVNELIDHPSFQAACLLASIDKVETTDRELDLSRWALRSTPKAPSVG